MKKINSVFFLLLPIAILQSCSGGDQEVQPNDSKTITTNKQNGSDENLQVFFKAIDTLYVTGSDFAAYYDKHATSGVGNDKAVFQFLWPTNSTYFTMGLYHANNHVYKHRGAERQPLLVLQNFKTGNNLAIPDTLLFGDLQVGVDRSSPPPVDNLKKIRDSLDPKPTDKILVFIPVIVHKHLAYEVYSGDKSELLDKDGKLISGFSFSSFLKIAIADPSPPATALN